MTVELVAEFVYVEDDAPDVVGDATHRTYLWCSDDVAKGPADASRQEHEDGHADGVHRIHEGGSEESLVSHIDTQKEHAQKTLGITEGRAIASAAHWNDTALCIAVVVSQEPVAGTHLFESVMPDGLASVLPGAVLTVFCFTERPGKDATAA